MRIGLHMLRNDNEQGWKQFSHLGFLNCSDNEELCRKYVMTRKEANNFFKLTDIFIKLTKITVLLFYIFVMCITARVFYTSFYTIPFTHIILSTLPNGISFHFLMYFLYESANAFFLIYFLGNIFISKSIKSISNRVLLSYLDKKEVIDLAKTNLKAFKGMKSVFQNNELQIIFD